MDPSKYQPPFPAPPGPFQDFEFSFASNSANHASAFLSPTGPPPPPIPLGFDFDFDAAHDLKSDLFNLNPGSLSSQAPLLSPTEHTNILGFLDAFDWDFNPTLPQGMPTFNSVAASGSSGSVDQRMKEHDENGVGLISLGAAPGTGSQDTSGAGSMLLSSASIHQHSPHAPVSKNSMSLPQSTSQTPAPAQAEISIQSSPVDDDTLPNRPSKRRKSSPSLSSLSVTPAGKQETPDINEKFDKPPSPTRKSLLSQPQKRLNHIMSEQRRRNAIKEGYATIEKLIAPAPEYAGPLPTLPGVIDERTGKPRGRSKGKGRGKGKMGTLFRAVEYCRFLEENVIALRLECERLEAAAALGSNSGHAFGGTTLLPGAEHYGMLQTLE